MVRALGEMEGIERGGVGRVRLAAHELGTLVASGAKNQFARSVERVLRF